MPGAVASDGGNLAYSVVVTLIVDRYVDVQFNVVCIIMVGAQVLGANHSTGKNRVRWYRDRFLHIE